jgi:deoxyxylulose-5-phosphate synthase
MMTVNGHLIFQTGTNHNITFKSLGGGYVNIDGENVQQLATMVNNSEKELGGQVVHLSLPTSLKSTILPS